jgi:endo-1,4-beta-xylanase
VPGAKVVTLWPAGSPALRALPGAEKPEELTFYKNQPGRVRKVINIHNPSIEVHLAPREKANGTAVVVAAGGGNKELNVGGEGLEIADWLNGLGVSVFIERYRLRPYDSTTDAVLDTQRSIRMVRARAKEWGLDPKRVGIMGFSAGGEQAAWVTLRFDAGNSNSADPVERESCRPDFAVLVYAGWRSMDLSSVPNDAPPVFLTSAGVDDAFHAGQTVQFYNALFEAKVPAELHIYGRGGHGGGIGARKGIPFGTWHQRFVEWAEDLGMMKRPEPAPAAAAAATPSR